MFVGKLYGSRYWRTALNTIGVIVISALVGIYSLQPTDIRYIGFIGLLLSSVYFSFRATKFGLFICVLYLPLMGLIRRILIPLLGWSSYDPFLLIVPLVILVLLGDWLYRRYIQRSALRLTSPLFSSLKPVIIMDLLEVFNPQQGGIFAGLGGILFYFVPIGWMFASYKFLERKWVERILLSVMIIGTLVALYGLKQTYFGFYPFEQQWIAQSGYAALIVGHSSRAFSSFSSAAEYAQFLGISVLVSFVVFLKGRFRWKLFGLVSLPLDAWAMFMESSRGILITTSLAVAAVFILSSAARRTVALRVAIVIPALVGTYFLITHIVSNNSLITHQVNGLANPFNQQDSTAGIHFAMMWNGIVEGIRSPLGHGLGSTTLAGAKFGNTGSSAEVDLSNMFISDGVLGGVFYLNFIIRVFVGSFKLSRQRTTVALACLGILILSVGSWSIGGNYSTTAVIWLLIGWIAKELDPLRHKLVDLQENGRFEASQRLSMREG